MGLFFVVVYNHRAFNLSLTLGHPTLYRLILDCVSLSYLYTSHGQNLISVSGQAELVCVVILYKPTLRGKRKKVKEQFNYVNLILTGVHSHIVR
jgi:hypothetical protein